MVFKLRGKELFRIEAGDMVIAGDCTREELVEAVLAVAVAAPDADQTGVEDIRRLYARFEARMRGGDLAATLVDAMSSDCAK